MSHCLHHFLVVHQQDARLQAKPTMLIPMQEDSSEIRARGVWSAKCNRAHQDVALCLLSCYASILALPSRKWQDMNIATDVRCGSDSEYSLLPGITLLSITGGQQQKGHNGGYSCPEGLSPGGMLFFVCRGYVTGGHRRR